MTCPECGRKSKTLDSRTTSLWRRRTRECLYCGHRFSTVEVTRQDYEKMVKNSRAVKKVLGSLYKILNKYQTVAELEEAKVEAIEDFANKLKEEKE